MNLPNKLTVLRMALIPVFLVFLLADGIPHAYLFAAAVFAAASFTDYLDGTSPAGTGSSPISASSWTRSRISCSSFRRSSASSPRAARPRWRCSSSSRGNCSSPRCASSPPNQGRVIAADIWGKLKTVFQIIWVLYTLLAMWVTWSLLPPSPESYSVWFFIGDVVLQAVVVLLTVLSGVNYVWKNRDLLSDVK